MSALEDLRNVNLGDPRRSRRMLKMVERLTADPAASFPDAMSSDAELDALYRFFSNQAVAPKAILEPHLEATWARAKAEQRVIVAHDTTEFSFSSDRDGLGPINDSGHGFFAHLALVLSADGHKRPLGVGGLHTWARPDTPRRQKNTHHFAESDRESYRWQSLALDVGKRYRDLDVIHVMDSEADAYDLWTALLDENQRFVIRLHHDRRVGTDSGDRIKLSDALPALQARFVREVRISSRKAPHHQARGRKRNDERRSRIATLEVTATSITLYRPTTSRAKPHQLQLNVVHVREVDVPAGLEPVDWKLVTTEPICTTEQIEYIVDTYRTRWVIEEFFKALKTGCAFETRQLETMAALLNALALFVPIAYEMLALRSAARTEPNRPASALLRPSQLLVLQRHQRTAMLANATVADALLAIARLGGHIKNNGAPGWIVLGRGYQKLLALEEGMLLTQAGEQS